MRRVLLSGLILLTAACGDSDDSNQVENIALEDGEQLGGVEGQPTKIDATNEAVWAYVDLDDSASLVDETQGWDIAFQRYKIKLNPSSVPPTAAAIVSQAFADVIEAPAREDYKTDEETENLEDGLVFNGLDPWYDYNVTTHILTPKADRTYVVYTGSHSVYAVGIVDYYDEFETPAFVSINFKKL